MKFLKLPTILLPVVLSACACNHKEGESGGGMGAGDIVAQQSIDRIDAMPNKPSPYRIIDWKQKAVEFDGYAFDFNSTVPAGPIIWIDNNQRNIPQVTFGLFTAIHDSRQGPYVNNGEFHEALTAIPAVIGAGLIGIDKTNQGGYNYVRMLQNYFNSDNGWNIVMNNTNVDVAGLGGGYGRDWWYDVLPNCLFYAVSDVFPGVENADNIMRTVADKFYEADRVLDGNYDFSYFNYGTMQGAVTHIPLQQDAAGGHGYVLYSAFQKFGDQKYLEGAKSAIAALDSQSESRFYEILLPLGIYTAARLNAEHGTSYDTKQMIDWVFDGNKDPNGRYGWGVIVGKWGNFDVSGLQGSITDGGGYAFFMNSMKMAWPLVPMVKYEPKYARAIGKWMLNNVNASRLFYPTEIPLTNQTLPGQVGLTYGIIAYEGLRKVDDYGIESLKGYSPVATGDGPKWIDTNPPETMFSVYSTAPVGMFGAIVATTDVEGILRLDCNATDFYASKPYPVYLYYNPYALEREVTYHADSAVDLYDAVMKRYVARNASGAVKFEVPGDASSLIYVLPAGTKLSSSDGRVIAGKQHVIVY